MGFISSIYNPPKPRGFNMPTRYYDKQKEDREHRRAVIQQKIKLSEGEELPKGIYISDLHRKLQQNKLSNKRSKDGSFRTILILVFLIYLAVLFITRI